MKKSKFSDSQIIETLKRAESGSALPELCGELGISQRRFTNGDRSTAAWMPRSWRG